MSTEPNRSEQTPMGSAPANSDAPNPSLGPGGESAGQHGQDQAGSGEPQAGEAQAPDEPTPDQQAAAQIRQASEQAQDTVRRALGEQGEGAGQAASAETEAQREAAAEETSSEPPPASTGEHPAPSPTSVGGPSDQWAGQAASAEAAQASGADMTGERPLDEGDAIMDTEIDVDDEEIDDEGNNNEDEDEDEDEEAYEGHVEPIEEAVETPFEDLVFDWYILKVQVNREDSICDALMRRVQRAGLEDYFREIVVPTEDVVEFTKSGKKRTVKRKLYPGYIMVNMALTEDTWFLVRETPGIGDFTGSAGRPTPMDPEDVRRLIKTTTPGEEGAEEVRIAIPFNVGDRVRVKEGYFQNFEGDVESIDAANGRVTVMINIFGRSTPVELQHWQMERL